MTRERVARLLLVVLGVALLAAVVVAPWHSTSVVDNRTYLEMTQGILRHGLPIIENGPAAQFPELQARWNVARPDGRLWGLLPPVFPYVAAPLLRLGGIRAVVRLNIALLGLIAWVTFMLGRRLTGNPLTGAVAAWLLMVSTPIWTFTFDVSPYTLATLLILVATWLAVVAFDSGSPRNARVAFLAGWSGGVGVGAHLLVAPMLGALIAALGMTPEKRRLAVWMVLGATAPLSAVAALNFFRFGSFNPISYGACVWRGCADSGLDQQSLGAMLAFAAPVVAWVVIAGTLLVWRRTRTQVIVVVAVSALLFAWPLFRERALRLALVAWGYSFDTGALVLGHGFTRPPDGLGNFLSSYAVKSPLQCTPLLALALLARGRALTSPRVLRVVTWPCVALFAALVLRANMSLAFALGFPISPHLRYLGPMLPLLLILAVGAAQQLPWTRWHLIGVAVTVAAFGAWLISTDNDSSYFRRWILLRASLLTLAVVLVLALWQRRRAAAAGAAVLVAWGLAVTLGVDLPAVLALRNHDDVFADRIARVTPSRFALIGYGGGLDVALSLRATRDVEYADLLETQGLANVRPLIAWWQSDGRPVFVLPWPLPPAELGRHARMEGVDAETGLYRVP